MKCVRHPHEGGPGVCPSCLREKLFALVAARMDGRPSPPQPLPLPQAQPLPLPLPLPSTTSVSPLSRRPRSDASATCRLSHLSFGTPEVGPSSIGARRAGSTKSSIVSNHFGHHPGSEEANPDPLPQKSPRSRHWLPSFIHGRRMKKISRLSSEDDAVETTRTRRSSHGRKRGPSADPGGSTPVTGYNSEYPGEGWCRTTPSPAGRGTGEEHHHRFWLAGLAMCLSPLLRPGPTRKQFQGAELGFSGQIPGAFTPRHHRRGAGALAQPLA